MHPTVSSPEASHVLTAVAMWLLKVVCHEGQDVSESLTGSMLACTHVEYCLVSPVCAIMKKLGQTYLDTVVSGPDCTFYSAITHVITVLEGWSLT